MSRKYLTPEQLAERRQWHERSYTHRLTPETDSNTVFATDMYTKNADRTLVDLSGNSNHGTVNGAVRSGGYFTDGMRFDGVDDEIGIVGDKMNITGDITLEAVVHPTLFSSSSDAIVNRLDYVGDSGYLFALTTGGKIRTFLGQSQYENAASVEANRTSHIIISKLGTNMVYYVDGFFLKMFTDVDDVASNVGDTLLIGKESGEFAGHMNIVKLESGGLTTHTIKSRFNSLAVLPLYSIDFSRYPSNTTVYDSNIPYSSMRIESGSFKIDGSQLVCVTDGTISMRNAHQFDGAEYISITADGVKTSDTGSVTAGTTTASITQGSTAITVAMVAGDVLDELYIQFRAPVE